MANRLTSIFPADNYFFAPGAFIAWNWFYAYCVLSSRTPKQWYGIDHNSNPRQDLAKYGDAAIKEGKVTRAQLEQIQRIEAASANSVDGFTLFVGAVWFGLITRLPSSTINAACLTYSLARLVYGAIYVFVNDDLYSQLRGIMWWTGNLSCMMLLWKGAQSGAEA